MTTVPSKDLLVAGVHRNLHEMESVSLMLGILEEAIFVSELRLVKEAAKENLSCQVWQSETAEWRVNFKGNWRIDSFSFRHTPTSFMFEYKLSDSSGEEDMGQLYDLLPSQTALLLDHGDHLLAGVWEIFPFTHKLLEDFAEAGRRAGAG